VVKCAREMGFGLADVGDGRLMQLKGGRAEGWGWPVMMARAVATSCRLALM
jgi:hypothetical protein